MSGVVMYSSHFCPFCSAAKRLLDHKEVAYEELIVDFDRGLRKEMMSKANGGHTVPQIFVGDTHVGGCDELYALEQAGKLDDLLSSVGQPS